MRSTGPCIHKRPGAAWALLALLLSIHPRMFPPPGPAAAPLSRAEAVLSLERGAPEGWIAENRTQRIDRFNREPRPFFAVGLARPFLVRPSSARASAGGEEARALASGCLPIPHDRAPPPSPSPRRPRAPRALQA